MRTRTSIAAFLATGLVLTGCAASDPNGSTPTDAPPKSVTLIVHDSFPAKDFEVAASAATGFDVKVVVAGEGELSTQLVLTKGAPLADAFYGVNDVYIGRLVENDVLAPFTPSNPMPERALEFWSVFGADGGKYVPIDLGAACFNIDPAWFAERGIPEPISYKDLLREEYRGLTVVIDPSTSSTGASLLIGTVAAFGEGGFADYWRALVANGARLESSWSDAYYGQFTGGGDGTYPIVLSYSSSPAWTLTDDGTASTTKALLDTCTSQVEYAGILKGAANPVGAQAVVDYLLSREFQDTIADTMYVYPIDENAYLPEDWQRFAPLPDAPNNLTSEAQIAQGLQNWLRTWSDATGW